MWSPRALALFVVAKAALGAEDPDAGASTADSAASQSDCHDAVEGDHCWSAANWAKTKGIFEHPEWYPGLDQYSSLAAFQAAVHSHEPGRCPRPCSHDIPDPVPTPAPGHLAAGESVPAKGGKTGVYMSNRESTGFMWTTAPRNFENTLQEAVAGGWKNPFGLSVRQVTRWIRHELLTSDPFDGRGVLVPGPESGDDQLGDGGWVSFSRRQVCYITAKAFFGAKTPGYDSGLTRLMGMCPHDGHFREAFASLLAACAADPTLKDGQHGPMLVVAKAGAAPEVSVVREAARTASMAGAGLRVCDYDTDAGSSLDGVAKVPAEGCTPRTHDHPGKDFMTGGIAGQATQDISAAWFGGYLFDSHSCGLGGGQDERLSIYFPEVTVLAYFLSASHQYPQLRQPFWVLGARNFFTGLDGTARFDRPLELADVPMNQDLSDVEVAGHTFSMSSSRPFLVFMSENQGFFSGSDSMHHARHNRLPAQRDVGHGKFAFEKQVRAWYRSVALSSYAEEVRPALKTLVQSIGAGPWLAGLWFGDSQVGILSMLLGQAIAAPTWGQPLNLDYYIYSDFTENPGNQCYVLSKDACEKCLQRCQNDQPNHHAYWLPSDAFMNGKPCVSDAGYCGSDGLQNIVATYRDYTADSLWDKIEEKLANFVDKTVFDVLDSQGYV